ncbi:GMC oxidoreductase [Auriscalpium vulgare]|uniref:GMC oxidoreductase n=1 Tax=Auriscalpium vulgare TaxID=40419 RepID=A0ACB8RK48_9AGAM|nr:GMC oxidoreductase [Auriscalpium vulgare]
MSTASAQAFKPEYDVIIAGGGTSAGVVAGRLAAADPSLRILMLEAGPSTRDLLQHTQPARFLQNLVPGSPSVRFHVGAATPALGGRPLIVPTGQCVGGGSSVNFLMYTRASRSDYDDWETVYGNKGWGSADLAPLLEKTETYQVEPDAPTHGTKGPLHVSHGGAYTNVGKQFLETARVFDKAREAREDADGNNLDTLNVYCRWPKWICGVKGTRSDVPHHYVYPQQDMNENFDVVTGAHVRRVIFDDNNRATGVEFVWNAHLYPDADRGVHTVKAARLVVLSSGTFGSPGILERSGVGKKDVLARVGVEQRLELPGVGEGYQDHNVLFIPYAGPAETDTIDPIVFNDPDAISSASGEWFKSGKGLMAHNSIDVAVRCRPSPDELEAYGEPFRKQWDAQFASNPDKPVVNLASVAMVVGDPTIVPAGKYFCLAYFTNYPLARGHAHITDAHDVSAPLDFSSGFLEDMADVVPLVWAYKHTREIARRMSLFRGEPAARHPAFAPDSAARLIERAHGPVQTAEPPIVYSAEDDRAIERFTRETVGTTWHSLGTCAMKPREQGGVVDSRLNVYGFSNLKVVDMSICPGNVASNTYSTALVVGEKAALIIAEELGITGV